MQALSSSALGAPVETQAASDPVERQKGSVHEGRRAAVERINVSQRHRLGVLPGVHVIIGCVCADYKFGSTGCRFSDFIRNNNRHTIRCRA